ncbi:Meiotic recombination protein SPO11 [Vulpes lagopus]
MAFAPMGPEASFFAVLDQHRASLLAALRRGGGEPAGGGTPQASSFNLKALRSVCEERKREACGETSR